MTTLRERIAALTGPDRETLLQPFLDKTVPEPNTGCWLWLGTAFAGKHGRDRPVFCFNGQHWLAHRAAMWMMRGPFPRGAFICHHCDTPMCVNPDHLYVGDHKSNMADMARRGRAHFARRPVHAHVVGLALGYSNTWARGAGNPKAKMTAEKVEAIRRDPRTTRAIADDHGLHISTIRRIRNGKLWPRLALLDAMGGDSDGNR